MAKAEYLDKGENPRFAEENLKLVTNLAVRADTKSRLVKEFVKATARKLESLRKPTQARLPISA